MEPALKKTDSYKGRSSCQRVSGTNKDLKEKKDELTRTKEELKKAKDAAMQSWLDSKPLLDELEKAKEELATAHKQSSKSKTVISELEAQLETTNLAIKAKKQQDLETAKTIEKLTQVIEQANGDRDALELHIDEQRRLRSKLKQLLRVRRQTLRALNLAVRASRAEAEAARAAAQDTQKHITNAENTKETIQLTCEEYRALRRRAKEKSVIADQRVSLAHEQKAAAEARKDSALTRQLMREMSSTKPKALTPEIQEVNTRPREGEGSEDAIESPVLLRPRARTQTNAKPYRVGAMKETRRTMTRGRRRVLKKKKKPSILHQIKKFFLRSINRLFR